MAIKEIINGIKLGTDRQKSKFALLPTKVWSNSEKVEKRLWFKSYTAVYEYTRKDKQSKAGWAFKLSYCD